MATAFYYKQEGRPSCSKDSRRTDKGELVGIRHKRMKHSTLPTSPNDDLALVAFLNLLFHSGKTCVRVKTRNVRNWFAMGRSENTLEELRGFVMTAPIERIWLYNSCIYFL